MAAARARWSRYHTADAPEDSDREQRRDGEPGDAPLAARQHDERGQQRPERPSRVFPPTWNSDCAIPCRPPDAIRATRELSGWNTADPSPTSPAETQQAGKLGPPRGSSRPTRVNPMPAMSEYGLGRWSVYSPIERLQQRCRELEREGDEPDLA